MADTRGGRNDTDPPMSAAFLPNQVTEALNIDWKDATFAHKRGGSHTVDIATGGSAFGSGIQAIGRHIPGSDETAAELWATDGAVLTKRLTGGTSWANVTFDDAISSTPQDLVGATLNGKRFLAFDSAVDRLHVYDPSLAAPRVRRVGIDPGTNAPTMANTGGGAWPAVLRYYRVRWWQMNGVIVVRKSEPTPSASFTPSGAGAATRITRPTLPGEGETAWTVEASSDDVTYRSTGLIAAATTTFDDSFSLTTFTTLVESIGDHSLFPSVRYLISDGNRLLGAGAWETAGATSGGKGSRVWFTPVLGSADTGDDERVPNQSTQKNWVDLNENDGGAVTGLGGPMNGVPLAFKYRQVWKLRPTGDSVTPYLPRKMRDDIGCIRHHTIAIAEDQIGRPALYFLSHRGPYRVTADGDVQYLGRDNEVMWRSMNLGATSVVAHSTYYPDLHQWWLWIATGSNNDPDTKMIFDVQKGLPDQNGLIRGGWAKHTGDSAAARCSCLFSNTLGASMSRDLKPYIGLASGTAVYKCDSVDVSDNNVNFQALVTTRPLLTVGDMSHKVGIDEGTIIASGTNTFPEVVQVTIVRDFGKETVNSIVNIAPSSGETRVIRKIEGSQMGEADAVQITVGDAAAAGNAWTIDAVIIPVVKQEIR